MIKNRLSFLPEIEDAAMFQDCDGFAEVVHGKIQQFNKSTKDQPNSATLDQAQILAKNLEIQIEDIK